MCAIAFQEVRLSGPVIAAVAMLLMGVGSARAAVHYVDLSSTNPTPPFASWATAAITIQHAVDAAAAGDEIVVTNGIYATGGRPAGTDVLVNRVAVDKPLTLRSLNGPAVTSIVGYQVPGTTNGDGAIRCVYLTSGASLSGFTLTQGATRFHGPGNYRPREYDGGGVWCESINAVVSNCVLTENAACTWGGGTYGGTLRNCTLIRNSANYGGGASGGTLSNCVLVGNSAQAGGGGAVYGTLNNCVLRDNWADYGGGASGGTLSNCVLTGNSASDGGGVYYGIVHCGTFTGNSARKNGGGVYKGRLNNCVLTGNTATSGGGAYEGMLNNCSLTGNSAETGGGVAEATLTNCLVYFNQARMDPNYSGAYFAYSCTTPLPVGPGNIAADPEMTDSVHISAASPCRGAGTAASVNGVDVDGEPWANPPSIGCDEYYAGAVTGDLSVRMIADYTNVAAGFAASFRALIYGRAACSVWNFADGVMVTNRTYASHAWTRPGDYEVILRAYNESHPKGVSATVTVHVAVQPVHYVAADGTNPVPPYASWATAATNIQDAVDAATAPGALVLVTNGLYATGGRAAGTNVSRNRVTVDKPLTLRSVNGPEFTVIQGHRVPGTINGDGAVRCVYLASGASLSGFTLTNGATADRENSGGGVWCESLSAALSNCLLTGNSAYYGGGAFQGTLNNCILAGNRAEYGGGAAYKGTLDNCTLTGNSASWGGGGVYAGTLTNCTLSGNVASEGGGALGSTLCNCLLSTNRGSRYGGGACYSRLNNCAVIANWGGEGGGAAYATLTHCTLTGNSAISGGGAIGGSLDNCIAYHNGAVLSGPNYQESMVNHSCTLPLPPSGVGNITNEPALAGPWRLSSASPCRGAGNPAYTSGVDLDGEPWLNPPSIGCDEYHSELVTGALTVTVIARWTNVVNGYEIGLEGAISGRASASRWEFGDGTIVSNQWRISHGWRAAGDYEVILRAYNDSYPTGVIGSALIHVLETPSVHYVDVNGTNAAAPYRSWSAAATNIQDAVDVAPVGAVVVVSDGVYRTGGRIAQGVLTNRVVVDKPLTLRSVNGPGVTVIEGYQVPEYTNGDGAIRCAYLVSGAVLNGFTLTGGATSYGNELDSSGGAVCCEPGNVLVTNCTLVRNSGSGRGGGAYGGTLRNCALTDNSAVQGGGAYFATLDNCILSTNVARFGSGGGASVSTLSNSVLTGNSAFGYYEFWDDGFGGGWGYVPGSGGGAHQSKLNDCTLDGNSADQGGGASDSTLNHCALTGNLARWAGADMLPEPDVGVPCGGGGAYGGLLNNCTLNGNSAVWVGGGAYGGVLNNCTLTHNSAWSGGGAHGGTLNNSLINGNRALAIGGGAAWATLYSCTLQDNAADEGGGAADSTLNNCIAYYNSAHFTAANYQKSLLSHCCSTPLPDTGLGNITNEPAFAGPGRLSWSSPCRGAGNPAYARGVDLDGEVWLNPPSIGCDEYHSGSITGALSVAIVLPWTNVAAGFDLNFGGLISGRANASRWDFGDGTVVSNQLRTSHSWIAAGDYQVVLRAYNEDYPAGVAASLTIRVVDTPVHHVSLGSTNSSPPYTSWSTAANNIQDAVDAASVPGSLVLVADGVYDVGGRAAVGIMTNRVVVDKPVTVRSMNGPQLTLIKGYQVPGVTNSDGAIRCIYLGSRAELSGFTLTNGATCLGSGNDAEQSGGGIWCESSSATVTNCILSRNSALWGGGGAYGGTFNNCTFAGNVSQAGGGAYRGTLNNCTLIGNSGYWGGGAARGTLDSCTLTGNSAFDGGGTARAELHNCTLSSNLAEYGGGACEGTLINCRLARNSASQGGGAYYARLSNCDLSGNSAAYGGGTYGSTLNNCTLTDNSAVALNTADQEHPGGSGGGALYSTLNNCIAYHNKALFSGSNYQESALNFCCTTPLPTTGMGNITNEPAFSGPGRLSWNSPCRGAGSAEYASGVDMDSEPWLNPPSIGCDEYHSGSVTGVLNVAIMVSSTNAASGFAVNLEGLISGRATVLEWDFGDGTAVSNQLHVTQVWRMNGDYQVVLRAYNDAYPAGVTATVTIHVLEIPVHYVDVNSTNARAPYTGWGTAANNIQDAVDAVSVPGALVVVRDGVYETAGRATGGLMTNRVVVDKPIRIESANGPAVTVIKGHQLSQFAPNGDGAIRCVYLGSGAVLSGFTLTSGATRAGVGAENQESAGGVWCESSSAIVTNCTLSGNSAHWRAGGAYGGTFNNCLLDHNSARYGGGAYGSALKNCALVANSAQDGGGVCRGRLDQCTVSSNSASCYGGGTCESTLENCRLAGNAAYGGGGAYGSTLNECTLTANSGAREGGGTHGGTLRNCTLTANSASKSGGGAYLGTLNGCILMSNLATGVDSIYEGDGGGAAYSTLNNCTLRSNSAHFRGGGSCGGTLSHCILTGNSAEAGGGSFGGSSYGGVLNNCSLVGNAATSTGGGAYGGTLNNCIIYYNNATEGVNYYGNSGAPIELNYCCTTPLPPNGVGSLTTPPGFVDYGNSDLHLQSKSPCINAGNNAYALGTTDLDGNPRIAGGTVDIGAYEFQSPSSLLSYAWLQQYGLPTDGSADYTDLDGDGYNTWQEWRCLTDPTNARSALRVLSAVPDGTNVLITWQSAPGVNYFLESTTDLSPGSSFIPIAPNIAGQADTTTYTHTNAATGPRLFYRVGVGN